MSCDYLFYYHEARALYVRMKTVSSLYPYRVRWFAKQFQPKKEKRKTEILQNSVNVLVSQEAHFILEENSPKDVKAHCKIK